MEKERSKSRSLRRKLLIAMVSCLIAVLGICTVIFQIIYQQASVNVDLYSGALAGQTVSVVSDAYYQQFLSAQQQYLRDFGREISLLYQNADEALFRDNLPEHAQAYFNSSDVFFLYDGNALCSYNLHTGERDASDVQDAIAVFDRKTAESPEAFGGQTGFAAWLDACREQPCGAYAAEGAGYIIAWDNLCNYSGENLCFGLLMQNVSSWVEPVRESADRVYTANVAGICFPMPFIS